MTGKAKAVKGSALGLDYVLNDKGTATEICRNGLIGSTGIEMFNEFRMITPNNPTKNLAISIVVSPHKSYTQNFTHDDWKSLCEDVMQKLGLKDHMYLCGLHNSRDTKHLHIYANRFSVDGSCFNDSKLAFRVHKVYDQICKERGWLTAREHRVASNKIEKQNILKIINEELKNKQNKTIEQFQHSLRLRGYNLLLTKNNSGYVGGRIVPVDYERKTTSKLEELTAKGGYKLSELDRNLRIGFIIKCIQENKNEDKMISSSFFDGYNASSINKVKLDNPQSLNFVRLLDSSGGMDNDGHEDEKRNKKRRKR